ncbi:tyrosine-type recombinase/integrase [Halorussus sp. AFM4]|uniref:tyrosine-type recombinase/integrase n=1 Tax=Halorussus sp. AFM4 TaxID=3421651 RepID=UPI003EBAC1EE
MPTMDYEGQAVRTLTYITESDSVHPANKELIQSYYRHMLLSGISPAQRQKLMAHLKIIVDHVGEIPFHDFDRDSIEDLVAWLYTRGTSESTVTDYKQAIKQFWKWMHDGEEPPETKWIKRGPQSSRQLLPQSLLTPADVEAMIDSCSNDRDRAFIAILWETGARIGELIDLRVGDIEVGVHGKHLIVTGKTGARRLLLLESAPFVDAWIAVHPTPTSTAFLWCKMDTEPGNLPDQIGYQTIRLKILDKARERAGIQKPVNPHHFRHSRATYLANYLTEAQMCEWFGWVRGSRVPGRYVHLSGRDIDFAYTAMLNDSGYQQLTPPAGV